MSSDDLRVGQPTAAARRNTAVRRRLPLSQRLLALPGQRAAPTTLTVSKVKVKFSRTRYRALGPELIPVYRGPIYKISYDNLTIILRQCESYDRATTDV